MTRPIRQTILFGITLLTATVAAAQQTMSTAMRFDYALHVLTSADAARDQQSYPTAIVLYDEAYKEYTTLMKSFPHWEPAVTQFRADHALKERKRLMKLSGLTLDAPVTTLTTNGVPVAPSRTNALAILTPSRGPTMESSREMARNYLASNAVEAAMATLLDALTLSPDDPSIRLLLGIAQCQGGNFSDALFILEPLAEEIPDDAAIHLALSAALVGIGDEKQARAVLEQILAHHPDSVAAHMNLAHLRLRGRKPDVEAARRHYDKALELNVARDAELDAQLYPAAALATDGQ